MYSTNFEKKTQQKLVKHQPKIKIAWFFSHKDINGNKLADKTTKNHYSDR